MPKNIAQTHQVALGFLGVASPAILVSFFLPTPWGEGLFTTLAAAFPVALIAVGLGRLRWVLAALLVVLEGSFLGMFLLRGQVDEGPWLFGLPLAAVLQLGGLFVVPLVLVPLAHGLTFSVGTSPHSSAPAGTAPELPLPAARPQDRPGDEQ